MTYSMYMTIFLPLLAILLSVLPIQPYRQVEVFSGNYTLFNNTECSTSTALDVCTPNTNGQWPTKTSRPTYTTNTSNKLVDKYRFIYDPCINLEITWEADIKNLKGFQIVLKPSGKPAIFRILDYTGAITNSSSGTYSFKFPFQCLDQQIHFTAELSPLPNNDNTRVFISTFDTVDCSLSPNIHSYTYDGRHLSITFANGPAKCNFPRYHIALNEYETNKEKNSSIVEHQDNVDELQAYFELDICEGYYKIMAVVYAPNQTCICKDNKEKCFSCIYGTSERLHLIPAKRCTGKDEPRKAEPNKLLFPLGIVIGLLFLTAVALYITHWKLSVHLTVKKRGIVLLLDDHDHHTNAVNKLVDYLNEYHLKVYLASAFLKNHDVPDEMIVIGEVLKSDFILLVLSSALQKRMDAWDKQRDYVEFFKEKNSNVLTKVLLEILLGSNKLYVCKFDHLAEFGCWPKPCYSLPRDLSKMVAELNGQSFSQRLAFCNCLRSNALRRELQSATKKTIMYEQSHANWFLEKYVCPTNVAVSQFVADETTLGESVGQSEYTDPLKLKEIFTDYRDTFVIVPEESITGPSIYSVPISEKLQAINERNPLLDSLPPHRTFSLISDLLTNQV